MGLKEWIIPQDRVFFDWLTESAKNSNACAQALADLFNNYDSLAERRQLIKDLEHKGDSITHSIYDGLGRSFILPLDREDIGALASTLDDVADFVYAAANRLYLYEVRKVTPEMRKFAEILVAQTKEITSAMDEIRNPKNFSATVKHTIEVHRLENEADRLLNESVASLFRGSDPIHILKHKEIYEILETATDKCEDVADVLSDIVRKHG